MPGWGNVFGWLFDRLPNKKESLRNQIDKTQKEMNELLHKEDTSANIARYDSLATKLRELEERLKNI